MGLANIVGITSLTLALSSAFAQESSIDSKAQLNQYVLCTPDNHAYPTYKLSTEVLIMPLPDDSGEFSYHLIFNAVKDSEPVIFQIGKKLKEFNTSASYSCELIKLI